jgi:hypothetical protein
MSNVLKSIIGATLLALTFVACKDGGNAVNPRAAQKPVGDPMFTMSSGSSSTVLGRATFADPDNQTFDVKRITGGWQMQIKSKPAFDIAVQRIKFNPGGQSGWHSHPGPVFIQVVYGTMTFYQSDDPTCSPIVRTAGQGYLDVGEHPHIAVNTTTDSSINLVTYFAPPGAVLKIDADAPANCPF